MFSIELDCPVSVNRQYNTNRKTGRRFLTAEAKAWKRYAQWEIAAARMRMGSQYFPIKDKVKVTRHFIFCDNRGRDHANYYKQLDDALVNGGILLDDKLIFEDTNKKVINPALSKHKVIVYIDRLR